MQYIGENLFVGQLGHFLVLLAFVSGILSAFAYYKVTRAGVVAGAETALSVDTLNWLRVGRAAFAAHGVGIVGTMACIFYVLVNHRYEYHFAWKVVNEQLPFKYIFSAFWQEQEGSFLLWMFWHTFFGALLIRSAKTWEAPVMTILALIQIVLVTMILGIYFPSWSGGEWRLGSNPLMLLREAMPEAPIFSSPDYLHKIQGKGLNPLLQNWWMTIHPPTLFYGFASTSIPFAFAVAGLWTRRFSEWVQPALPWALMSGAVLGTGILMGGAWAYEALSFGGYWAWDPVENMSLVPWLILVAAIHSMLVARATGHSLRAAFAFSIGSFLLITYSTFLTRSGILGDTSVHAFTEMGLEWQLIGFIGLFTIIGYGLFFKNYRKIPEPVKEESVYTREFWMFIGTLVLLFSSILITFTTSIPVWNKIITVLGDALHFKAQDYIRRPPNNAIAHYNQYQIWIGILMGLFSGVGYAFRYRLNINKKAVTRLGVSVVASAVLTGATIYFGGFTAWQFYLLLFSSYFGILANADFLFYVIKNKIPIAGGAVAHIGFALLMIGALFSGANKLQISKESFMKVGANTQEGFTAEDAANNVLLYKGLPTQMSDYELTYKSDTVEGLSRFFTVHYKRFDKNKKVQEEFDLRPNVLYTIEKDKVAASNPSTKRYFTKDVFTHIVSLPIDEADPMAAAKSRDTIQFKKHELSVGDTIFTTKNYVTYEGLVPITADKDPDVHGDDIAVEAVLKIRELDNNNVIESRPRYTIHDNTGQGSETEAKTAGLIFRFDKIDGFKKKIFLSVGETQPKRDFIVLSAIVFPGINLVWIGSTMMMLGLLMAMWQRIKKVNAVSN